MQRKWQFRSVLTFTAAAGFVVVGLVALCVSALDVILTADRLAPDVAVARTAPAHMVLADEWSEQISRETYWKGRGAAGSRGSSNRGMTMRPSRLQGPPVQPSQDFGWFGAPSTSFWDDPDDRPPPRQQRTGRTGAGGYRTVCVRTCDGAFFPISFGVHEGQFARDQAKCSDACPGARLYSYRASGEDPNDMVDMNGQPYHKMKNANLFRTQYVESCKCKPNPWEQEATERHRIYALEEQRRKGDRSVVAELTALKAKARAETPAQDTRQAEKRSRKSRRQQVATAPPPAAPQPPAGEPERAQSTMPRSDASRGQGAAGVMPGAVEPPGAGTVVTPSLVKHTVAKASPAAEATAESAARPAAEQPAGLASRAIVATPAVEAAIAPEPQPAPPPRMTEPAIADGETSEPVLNAKPAQPARKGASRAGRSRATAARNYEPPPSRSAGGDWVRNVFNR